MANAEAKGCSLVYSVNALTLMAALKDPAYGQVLTRGDILLADGVGAVWAAKRLTGLALERVAGIDLIDDLCAVCAAEGQSVYLLGGRPGIAQAAGDRLCQRHPGLTLAGVRDGYWAPADENRVVDTINQSGAGLLLVGLGQPAQEFFLDGHRPSWRVRVALGVGGSFDVIAQRLARAPRWMQRVGLEWLFRGLQEPWRFRRMGPLFGFVWMLWWRGPKKHSGKDASLCKKP